MVLAQAGRDLRIAFRSGGEAVHPLAFFALAVTLFGLGLGSDLNTLGAVAVVAVWVIALLACMLAAEGLFRRDFEDGTLEQMLLHGRPVFLAVLGKQRQRLLQSIRTVVVERWRFHPVSPLYPTRRPVASRPWYAVGPQSRASPRPLPSRALARRVNAPGTIRRVSAHVCGYSGYREGVGGG